MADEGAAGGAFPRDYRRLARLYCMNGGHHLQILPDGTVRGLRDDGDAHSKSAEMCAFSLQDGPAPRCVCVPSDTAAGVGGRDEAFTSRRGERRLPGE